MYGNLLWFNLDLTRCLILVNGRVFFFYSLGGGSVQEFDGWDGPTGMSQVLGWAAFTWCTDFASCIKKFRQISFIIFFSSKNKVIFFEDAYKSEDGHRTWETGRQFIIYLFIYFSPKKFALFSKLKFSVLNGVYNIYIYFKKLFSSSAYKYQIKTPFFNSLFSYPRERRAGDNLPSVSLSLSRHHAKWPPASRNSQLSFGRSRNRILRS